MSSAGNLTKQFGPRSGIFFISSTCEEHTNKAQLQKQDGNIEHISIIYIIGLAYFFQKLGKMSQNLTSAAVVIAALGLKTSISRQLKHAKLPSMQ